MSYDRIRNIAEPLTAARAKLVAGNLLGAREELLLVHRRAEKLAAGLAKAYSRKLRDER